ncbi:MAG: PfkB family carbohydrate kinase, partial [Actinomycetota bacterium]
LYAPQLEGFLTANGVGIAGVRRDPEAATGIALIVVDANGENTIVAIPGANALLEPSTVTAVPQQGDVLLAQFETPFATTAAFFAAGREVGAVTVLNAAPAADPGDLLALTDVLVINQIELAACTGEPRPGAAAAEVGAAARRLQRRGPGVVVVTLGRRGVIAVDGPVRYELAAHRVVATDATGAGDCFTGSLAARLAAADPFDEALAYANAAASVCVERPGAGPSMPTVPEVRTRLSEPPWPHR